MTKKKQLAKLIFAIGFKVVEMRNCEKAKDRHEATPLVGEIIMKTIVKRNPILTDSDCKFLETAYKRLKELESKLNYDSDWAADAIWQLGNNEGVPYFRHLVASQNHYYRKRTREMEKELKRLLDGKKELKHMLKDLKRSKDSNDTGDTQRT